MFGYNPIATAPVAATDKVIYLFTGVYNGTAADVPTLTAYEDETFSAPNVVTGTVRIGTGVLAQTHAVATTAIDTGAPSIDSGTLAQVHVLAAPDLDTGNLDINTLSAFEDETFSAPDIDAGVPTVDTTAISQVHAVSGLLTIGAPTVGEGDATINYVFAPPEVLAGMDVGQLRFQWMEQYFDAEIWTEQSVSSVTWTEAA